MKQKIFIGSSSEGQSVCDALVRQLTGVFEVVPWHISFPASHTAIEALLNGLQTHHFGVFVMSADDHANVRGRDVVLPRDNVLFEAGIFMGLHGLRRTYLVCPSEPKNFHLLSDVSGVTVLKYDPSASSMGIAVAPVALEIKDAIDRANGETPNVSIQVGKLKQAAAPGLIWPVKLELKVKNNGAVSVTVQSTAFRFGKGRQATNNYVLGGRVHNVAFSRWIAPGGKNHDQFHEVVFLRPGEEVLAWVAFDKDYTDAELSALQAHQDLGIWAYRTIWHDSTPRAYDHELVV